MNQRSIEIFSTFLRTRGYAEQTNHIYSKVLELVPDTWNTDDPKLLYEHINSTMKALEPTLKLTTKHNLRTAARQFFLLKTGIIYKDYVYKTNRQCGTVFFEKVLRHGQGLRRQQDISEVR